MHTVCTIKYLEVPLLASTGAYFSSEDFVINLKLIIWPLFFSVVNLTLKIKRDYSVLWFLLPSLFFQGLDS